MEITVNSHSSIRLKGEKTLWVDPFQLRAAPRDGQIILLTHSHYDHYSPEDIGRAAAPGAVFVAPLSMAETLQPLGRVVSMSPGETALVEGIRIEAVPAYNPAKKFHPRENGWLGYVVTLGEERIYVCGDTDLTPEARTVSCDVLLVPVGGTYTMDAAEAAELARSIRPKLAIPTHYGSTVGKKEDGEIFRRLVGDEIPVTLKVEDTL